MVRKYKFFKSHGCRVSRDDARAHNINIIDLEKDQELQDLVLSVHHAISHTFAGTPVTKLIENHNGRAYIESRGIQVIQQRTAAPSTARDRTSQTRRQPR